jgi:hypothetical protein
MSDPTDYKAEFFKLRKEMDRLADWITRAELDAEKMIRPHLTTGGVFGITPDHKFKPESGVPFALVEQITQAILSAQKSARNTER